MNELITNSGTLAVPFETVKKAIAEIRDIQTLKSGLDKTAAFQAYVKAADVSLEIQNEVAATRLLFMRQIGLILAEMPKAVNQYSASDTLSEAGVHPRQSSRWQTLAKLTDDEFDDYVNVCCESKKEVTATGALKLAKTLHPPKSEPVAYEERTGICYDLAELDGKQFGCIYADPPWQYGNQGTRASTDNHYQTMTVKEICEMPVADLVADDAHLHLWVTNGFVFDAESVMEAWGFEFKSMVVWEKPQMGLGNYWRVCHEFLMLGVRGKAKRFPESNLRSVMRFPRRKHSQKPREFRDIIERVSPGPRLELFGRDQIEGWTVFGNQIDMEVLV